MIFTNGNRRPKHVLKLVLNKWPNMAYAINRRLSGGSSSYGMIPSDVSPLLDTFKKEHGDKILFALMGNESRGRRGVRQVEVFLYALPKDSVHEIKWTEKVNPVVSLKSDFIFEDKDVGGDQKVTVLIDQNGEYLAYDIDDEAKEAIRNNPKWASLGRHPFIIQDDQLYLGLPVAKHLTRKEAINRKAGEMPRIELTKSLKSDKGSFTIEDASVNPNKPRKVYMTSVTDLNDIQEGRYPAVIDGVYYWLIKSTFQVKPLEINNFILLRQDHEGIEEIPLMEVPVAK